MYITPKRVQTDIKPQIDTKISTRSTQATRNGTKRSLPPTIRSKLKTETTPG